MEVKCGNRNGVFNCGLVANHEGAHCREAKNTDGINHTPQILTHTFDWKKNPIVDEVDILQEREK